MYSVQPAVEDTRSVPGWAGTAGVMGIVSAGVSLALVVGSGVTLAGKHPLPAAPALGGASVLVVAVMGPLVAAGASSARTRPEVRGILGLRIVGWIAYGLTIADIGAMAILGIAGHKPVEAQIASCGVLEMATMGSFVADAFVSSSQATSLLAQEESRRMRASLGPMIVPVVLTDSSRQHSPGLAFALSF